MQIISQARVLLFFNVTTLRPKHEGTQVRGQDLQGAIGTEKAAPPGRNTSQEAHAALSPLGGGHRPRCNRPQVGETEAGDKVPVAQQPVLGPASWMAYPAQAERRVPWGKGANRGSCPRPWLSGQPWASDLPPRAEAAPALALFSGVRDAAAVAAEKLRRREPRCPTQLAEPRRGACLRSANHLNWWQTPAGDVARSMTERDLGLFC